MTVNDKLLLEEFKAAKIAFDATEVGSSIAIAQECGRTLQNLKYLDDLELRAQAAVAGLDFGPPSAWPETSTLHERCKAAERQLVNAINQAETTDSDQSVN